MPKSRLFELVYYLLAHGRTSAQVLADRFEVSVRTIYRDVEALSGAGVPVYTIPGRNGGVALMDHYTLDRALLTGEEQDKVLAALRSLSASPLLDTEEALGKLAALFRRQEPQWLEVALSPWGDSQEENGQFALLREAILARKVIHFTYVAPYRDPAPRRVLPVKLIYKGQAWYLQGYCLDRQDYRIFRLSRMADLTATGETLTLPSTPPPPQIDSAATPAPVHLRLRLSPQLAFRAYDEFSPAQLTPLPDGSFEVEVTFPEDGWVYGYLLSFGPGMEVLEPPHIRRELARLAKEIGAIYEKDDGGCQD